MGLIYSSHPDSDTNKCMLIQKKKKLPTNNLSRQFQSLSNLGPPAATTVPPPHPPQPLRSIYDNPPLASRFVLRHLSISISSQILESSAAENGVKEFLQFIHFNHSATEQFIDGMLKCFVCLVIELYVFVMTCVLFFFGRHFVRFVINCNRYYRYQLPCSIHTPVHSHTDVSRLCVPVCVVGVCVCVCLKYSPVELGIDVFNQFRTVFVGLQYCIFIIYYKINYIRGGVSNATFCYCRPLNSSLIFDMCMFTCTQWPTLAQRLVADGGHYACSGVVGY